jgi:hypothetical protein
MFPMVYVKWHDAHAVAPSWICLDDIDDEPAIVESVGWVLHGKKDGHIVLAQSITDNEGDHILAIPVGMVRSMKVLL